MYSIVKCFNYITYIMIRTIYFLIPKMNLKFFISIIYRRYLKLFMKIGQKFCVKVHIKEPFTHLHTDNNLTINYVNFFFFFAVLKKKIYAYYVHQYQQGFFHDDFFNIHLKFQLNRMNCSDVTVITHIHKHAHIYTYIIVKIA